MYGSQVYWLLNGAQFIPHGAGRTSEHRLETGRVLPAQAGRSVHAGEARRSVRQRVAEFMKRS